jgi:hypothetical protein
VSPVEFAFSCVINVEETNVGSEDEVDHRYSNDVGSAGSKAPSTFPHRWMPESSTTDIDPLIDEELEKHWRQVETPTLGDCVLMRSALLSAWEVARPVRLDVKAPTSLQMPCKCGEQIITAGRSAC